jgi:hypothetical protein
MGIRKIFNKAPVEASQKRAVLSSLQVSRYLPAVSVEILLHFEVCIPVSIRKTGAVSWLYAGKKNSSGNNGIKFFKKIIF